MKDQTTPEQVVNFRGAGDPIHGATDTDGACVCGKSYKTNRGLSKHIDSAGYRERAQFSAERGIPAFAHVAIDPARGTYTGEQWTEKE